MLKGPTINLPLHGGHAPAYLVRRMIKLSYSISKVIVDEYGSRELLSRLSDPLWFQAFGCVLGFDWHSSGVTTVVTGILKQSLKPDIHGVSICGGKGKKSTTAKNDIPRFADYYSLSSDKIDRLLYSSKMAAKVDGAAVQDGYSLYHHTILFDKSGNWVVVQQGMNAANRMARRYHWASDTASNFVRDPHAGIICVSKTPNTLNMATASSEENQKLCVDLVRGDPDNLKSSVYRLMGSSGSTLDKWIGGGSNGLENRYATTSIAYEMPRRLDWGLFKKIYDIQPKNYEDILSISGVGPSAVRALSLIAELIYGSRASWDDPVKYNFAHGGKDGVPYPVARRVYDRSIAFLSQAIEGAEVERNERIESLKKLAEFSKRMFPALE